MVRTVLTLTFLTEARAPPVAVAMEVAATVPGTSGWWGPRRRRGGRQVRSPAQVTHTDEVRGSTAHPMATIVQTPGGGSKWEQGRHPHSPPIISPSKTYPLGAWTSVSMVTPMLTPSLWKLPLSCPPFPWQHQCPRFSPRVTTVLSGIPKLQAHWEAGSTKALAQASTLNRGALQVRGAGSLTCGCSR